MRVAVIGPTNVARVGDAAAIGPDTYTRAAAAVGRAPEPAAGPSQESAAGPSREPAAGLSQEPPPPSGWPERTRI